MAGNSISTAIMLICCCAVLIIIIKTYLTAPLTPKFIS